MRSAAQLRDEIGLREASLVDARREHADGEIDDERFATIVEREESALATLREELAHVESQVSEDPVTVPAARRHRRRWLALALACFALAAGFLVWANLGLRQAGSSATGGLSLSQTQRVEQLLTEGEADIATGDVVAALAAYDQVLSIQPTNVNALTEAGWLDFSAGSATKNASVVARGVRELTHAVEDAPTSAAPRLYFAIAAGATPGERTLARNQFEIFVRLHPTAAQLAIARPYMKSVGLNP